MWMIWNLMLACMSPDAPPKSDSSDLGTIPWSGELARTSEELPPQRGWQPRRGIVHLHSPWSHDACDGQPMPDGKPDSECLADLRRGLCETKMDFAYLTDHPAHAADQAYEDLFHTQPGDEAVEVNGVQIASRIPCEDDGSVLWMPGIEDTLMPVGLESHAGTHSENNHEIYDSATPDAIEALQDSGSVVLVAHTEGKDLATLTDMMDAGVQGLEIFNLHAAFDPSKREDDLGLDGLAWLTEITPFTSPDGTGEPDLFFLAVLQEQTVSVQRWDALSQDSRVIGVAGTDAHQNVLPLDLRDGERGDSYRRMLRWFSNHLLIDEEISEIGPTHTDEALSAGRGYVAFEILGTPAGFDFYLEDADGVAHEMGSNAPSGSLVVQCPSLSARSPRGLETPEISATIFKNGEEWSAGCGDFPSDGPGVYRVRVDILPKHLTDFLGDEPKTWLHSYPWVYSNSIRVTQTSEGE